MTNKGSQKNQRRGRPNPQAWVPPKDGILGGVDPQAKDMVFGSQQRVRALTLQIGQLELQKDNLLRQIRQINADAQKIVDKEAERLGIPPGIPWQMGGDGVARLVPPQGIPQAAPPAGPTPVPDPPADEPPADDPPSEGEADGEETPPDGG